MSIILSVLTNFDGVQIPYFKKEHKKLTQLRQLYKGLLKRPVLERPKNQEKAVKKVWQFRPSKCLGGPAGAGPTVPPPVPVPQPGARPLLPPLGRPPKPFAPRPQTTSPLGTPDRPRGIGPKRQGASRAHLPSCGLHLVF
jgi:hypothetical protein